VSLGAAASAGDEEDEAPAAAVRARFGAIAERGKGITRERVGVRLLPRHRSRRRNRGPSTRIGFLGPTLDAD
jgi:hypothetical protein